MDGLDPSIHVLPRQKENVDGRIKSGHDVVRFGRSDRTHPITGIVNSDPFEMLEGQRPVTVFVFV